MGKAKKILGAENSRLLMMHAVFILCVSVILGVMNMIGGKYLIGGIIIGVGALTLLFVTLFKNKMKYIVVATTITQIQLILIMAMAIAQHALHGMFPLMLASMAMGGVYFNKKNLLIHWIVMTVVSVAGIFFFDFFYLNSDIMAILKGIVAMNIGAFFIYYLVRFAKTQMDSVKIAEAKSAELLEKVKEQVEQTEAIAADQKRVVEQLAGISETVTDSSNRMKNIAEAINNSAAEQNTAINEISGQITQAAEETQTSISESRMASQTALRSKELLNMSAEKIDDMLKAMSEIAEKSEQIQGIVKAIEDIAFQTNILALNASVEAARAGEMGKGFAVVADEVRNLANKSQEAVQNTSELITACIAAVDVGKKMADDVAENMQEVIETANQSAEHARLINEQTKRQAVVISSVNENMSGITDIVNSTAQTAAESMKIAASVAEDAAKMDDIVKNYR